MQKMPRSIISAAGKHNHNSTSVEKVSHIASFYNAALLYRWPYMLMGHHTDILYASKTTTKHEIAP